MKEIKISIIAILLAFLAITVGFALILREVHLESISKELKISALIDEVGELKETNDRLYDFSEKNSGRLKNIYNQLNQLNKSFQEGITGRVEAVREMKEMETVLSETLKEKEQTIGQLAHKNLQLKEELAAVDYSEEIVDILVIGENSGLTDALHLVSINPANLTVTAISLPRDLYHKGRKINELYNLYGIEKLKEAIEQVTGIKPDKHVIFDFKAFVTLIDDFGGVEINVEKDLTDNQYPGPDHTYSLVTFRKGLHVMDGNTALKYARSRKSTTDFDRSFRQQQVMGSLAGKIRGMNLVQNLEKLMSLYEAVKENVKTDISVFEALAYFERFKDFKIEGGNVISNRNFLYTTVSKSGQYILLPINGSYSEIKTYVSRLVKE